MMSIVLGLCSLLLGSWGVYFWFGNFIFLLKGLLPISFVCAGIIAILAGISSLRK
ncbi:MAG: hypothetical protein HYT97_03875 [Elusimicrobia bacterium]|nr:hypothetical protein [Elusimicrobiota bacterium]